MKRSNTLWRPLPTAELDWPEGQAPRSPRFSDIYYSASAGQEESRYVFLEGNNIPTRWKNHPHPEFCVVETGFGTGLNFLLTWASWLEHAPDSIRLHYISVEKYPVAREDLARALANWPALSDLADQLLDHYPEPLAGQHRIVLEQGQLTLDLWWEDAGDALPELADGGQRPVDAWFLDGFAPARNENMWNEALYAAMAASSRAGATFATFTAASAVRRGLYDAGFEVEKAPGFGHKRECLRGHTAAPLTALPVVQTPWHLTSTVRPGPRSALVIGAGLAGCTIAAALAQRGIQVIVVEENEVASAGSGNSQGILYTRLSTRHSALTDFSLQSFCFAHRFYRNLFESGQLIEGEDGALCGSFHQSNRTEEMSALAPVLATVPGFAQVLDTTRASQNLAVTPAQSGYWFPGSGWLRPAAVCRALLAHPAIQLLEHAGKAELQPTGNSWQAIVNGRAIAEADCAIIATGTAANQQPELTWLPLQAIRGQTTDLPGGLVPALKAGLCHTGYISPARDGVHCIGATFDLNDKEPDIRNEDHRRNLDALAAAVPDWRDALAAVDDSAVSGRVSYRCATPDYLPIVGPAPDYPSFLQTYAGLRSNAKQLIAERGSYLPGLFLTTGHGSRGLTYTPLAAQALANQICGEALPLATELQQAISPARFIIRNLKRSII
ncbi:MAG: bifunctional tRNA (5-methylaminomethyl-2-thiouridine)(34)-methyltransferase MnmD/FAD-dependent 5-carboxymethylaminomethyl-2-thiouridine(34) oxidoreductase MnmC [Halioglobus sp.]